MAKSLALGLEVGCSLGRQCVFKIPFLFSWNWCSTEGDKASTVFLKRRKSSESLPNSGMGQAGNRAPQVAEELICSGPLETRPRWGTDVAQKLLPNSAM